MAKAKTGTTPAAVPTVVPKMPPSLVAIRNKVRLAIGNAQVAMLQAYYEAGLALTPAESGDVSKYGSNPIGMLAEDTGISDEQLYKMIKFVQVFSKPDLNAISKLQTAGGGHLGWGHVIHLLSVTDRMERFRWAEKAAEKGWTADQLGKELVKSRGNQRPGSGRKHVQPKSLEQGVSNYGANVDDYRKRRENVWDPMIQKVYDSPPDSYDELTLDHLEEMKKSAKAMANEVNAQVENLTKVISHVKTALHDQAGEQEEQGAA